MFHDLFIPVRDVLWKQDSETQLLPFAQKCFAQMRLLTGFDSVMMYRIDPLHAFIHKTSPTCSFDLDQTQACLARAFARCC